VTAAHKVNLAEQVLLANRAILDCRADRENRAELEIRAHRVHLASRAKLELRDRRATILLEGRASKGPLGLPVLEDPKGRRGKMDCRRQIPDHLGQSEKPAHPDHQANAVNPVQPGHSVRQANRANLGVIAHHLAECKKLWRRRWSSWILRVGNRVRPAALIIMLIVTAKSSIVRFNDKITAIDIM